MFYDTGFCHRVSECALHSALLCMRVAVTCVYLCVKKRVSKFVCVYHICLCACVCVCVSSISFLFSLALSRDLLFIIETCAFLFCDIFYILSDKMLSLSRDMWVSMGVNLSHLPPPSPPFPQKGSKMTGMALVLLSLNFIILKKCL